jgi:hypothetical protein
VPQSALLVSGSPRRISPATEPRTSGKSIASLVFGILGLPVVGILVGWFAIWFGIMALSEIDWNAGLQGRKLAIAGITLGIASIVLWAILLIVYGPSLSR